MKQSIITMLIGLPLLGMIARKVEGQPRAKPVNASCQIVSQHAIHSDTPVHCLFLDKVHHRLLAQVGDDSQKPVVLYWLNGASLRTLMTLEAPGFGHTVLNVDFLRRRVYWREGTGAGGGGYLNVTPFPGASRPVGDLDTVSNEERTYVICFIGGKQKGRNYRVHWPAGEDVWYPVSWAGVYAANKLVKRVEVGYTPQQLLYVPILDQLWFIQSWQLKSLDGITISLPNEKAPDKTGQYPGPFWGPEPFSVVDTDRSGKVAYTIDVQTKSVYKLSLSTGKLLGQRTVPFVPKSIVVDGGLNQIHLLDKSGKQYITISAF